MFFFFNIFCTLLSFVNLFLSFHIYYFKMNHIQYTLHTADLCIIYSMELLYSWSNTRWSYTSHITASPKWFIHNVAMQTDLHLKLPTYLRLSKQHTWYSLHPTDPEHGMTDDTGDHTPHSRRSYVMCTQTTCAWYEINAFIFSHTWETLSKSFQQLRYYTIMEEEWFINRQSLKYEITS